MTWNLCMYSTCLIFMDFVVMCFICRHPMGWTGPAARWQSGDSATHFFKLDTGALWRGIEQCTAGSRPGAWRSKRSRIENRPIRVSAAALLTGETRFSEWDGVASNQMREIVGHYLFLHSVFFFFLLARLRDSGLNWGFCTCCGLWGYRVVYILSVGRSVKSM